MYFYICYTDYCYYFCCYCSSSSYHNRNLFGSNLSPNRNPDYIFWILGPRVISWHKSDNFVFFIIFAFFSSSLVLLILHNFHLVLLLLLIFHLLSYILLLPLPLLHIPYSFSFSTQFSSFIVLILRLLHLRTFQCYHPFNRAFRVWM